MSTTKAIAIFDIGKTNKKLFLFDERYNIVLEKSKQLAEVKDEDGDNCEDIVSLTQWIKESLDELQAMTNVQLQAVNFSAYGASFVHIDREGNTVAPLYNYLKPFPPELQKEFYKKYGGEADFSVKTASPVLGNLNSGLQLYLLKENKPAIFKKIHVSLHLPQYLSFLVSGRTYSDITSIGCHTGMWNFIENRYHEWLYQEGITEKLAPVFPSDQVIKTSRDGKPLLCGVGLHDSSAALIPYLSGFNEPFMLLSTGTWCISLNPFNQARLTAEELQQDCLCYMEYRGKPIKASRLFAGYEHEQQTKRLAEYFAVAEDYYKNISFDAVLFQKMQTQSSKEQPVKVMMQESAFGKRDLKVFADYSEAYHQLILDIMLLQVKSAQLVLKDCPVKKIFVDGGFSKNPLYMNMLAAFFPNIEVYAASVAQASAIGAALAIHHYWNKNKFPEGLIDLKLYADIEAIEI
ncbi:MAG: FGGY family carbohydrate kinase [Chitinophagaceae bacterium]